MDRRQLGIERRRVAEEMAQHTYGVVSRAALRQAGIGRDAVRSEVRARRWKAHGRQTIAIHTGPLPEEALWWRGVWEVGATIAALDGVTSLRAAGLTGYETDHVEVSIPHGCRPAVVPGLTPRSVVARHPGEVVRDGVPRVRSDIAALRAASWAVSDRQAALVLCLAVQQRLVASGQLMEQMDRVALLRRPAFIKRVVRDIHDGAESLGELDFMGLCREYGLPEPTRQSVRRTSRGRVYLDVAWDDIGLVVEIDGSQHRLGLGRPTTCCDRTRSCSGTSGCCGSTWWGCGSRSGPSWSRSAAATGCCRPARPESAAWSAA